MQHSCVRLLLLCLLAALVPARAVIDLNGDGIGDIYDLKYHAAGIPPGGDADGDGETNAEEGIAGTDPWSANSRIAVSSATIDASGVRLSWPSIVGKRYQVQSAAGLTNPTWLAEGASVDGTGAEIVRGFALGGTTKFYRVLVQDMDSDGDGVTDWEERQVGFNPNSPTSAIGGGQGDLAAITHALQTPNVVKISAEVPIGVEPDAVNTAGVKPRFKVTRTGGLDSLIVALAASGTATSGSDYLPLPGWVMIPMGSNEAYMEVTPLPDTALETSETLKLTATFGASTSATVAIEDPKTPTGTGLRAQYYDTSSGTYANAANFDPAQLKVTRVDATVNFDWLDGRPNTAVNADNFSGKWEGYLAPTVAGNYLFDLQADDGARLFINNVEVINAWTPGSSTATPMVSGPVALAIPATRAERIAIRVEYQDVAGTARLQLRWQVPGTTTFATIPVSGTLANNRIYRNLTDDLTGLIATYYNNTTLTAPAAYTQAGLATTSVDWGIGRPDPLIQPDTFSVRWTGQVQPQYSEEYTFVLNTDDGVKLWINGQPLTLLRSDTNAVIDWTALSTDRYARIALQAGQRYDIRIDYFESTGPAKAQLSWYSLSQPKQIIPQSRLYPASVPQAPPALNAIPAAVALVGAPFSYRLPGSNAATVTLSGAPGWLSFVGGVLSGTPPAGAAGDYQILITVSNAAGTSTTVLNLHVEAAGGSITREYWADRDGNSVVNFPTTAPTGTGTAAILEGPTGFSAEGYASRLRGYITAPATGNYYFWIAARDAAELWISDDAEPVNKIKRAFVLPGAPTAPRSWNESPTQKSPWLALEAGKKYYVEILHKADSDSASGAANDHVAVGWSMPGEPLTAPSGVVPGYALSPWIEQPPVVLGGKLYAAVLTPQGGAATLAYGTSTIHVNEDQTEAVIVVNYSNLSSEYFGMHVHDDEIPGGGLTNVICDIDQPGDAIRQQDGSFLWKLKETSGRSVATLLDDLERGKVYFNVHSTPTFPSGEIKGYYRRLDGALTFTAPPPAGSWTSDHSTVAGASRFLIQSTFGPSAAEIGEVQARGFRGWIDNQFSLAVGTHIGFVDVNREQTNRNEGPYPGRLTFNAWWKQSVTSPDQLRQRVAFALSEILVVSENGPLDDRADALSTYYDALLNGAFGNFRQLLEAVTLHPAMGRYLDMLRNDKPDLAAGRIPNENYSREILQLFSIGLYRHHPDGAIVLNSKGQPVPTYEQREIVGVAHVFTGWDYFHTGTRTTFGAGADWRQPMTAIPVRHFTGPKRVLNNVVLPGLPTVGGVPLDPYATHVAAQYNDAAYRALPAEELKAAHDQIFEHGNTAPFICRQLIQRLVTSTPSRGYVYRVVQAFSGERNVDGVRTGVRGDMRDVIRAILLDYEARSSQAAANPGFGKLREPLLRVTGVARALPAPPASAGTYTQSANLITIDTTTPHGHTGVTSAYLDFSAGTAGDLEDAPYTITALDADTLKARPLTSFSCTWSQAAAAVAGDPALVTVTTSTPIYGTVTHEYTTGTVLYMDFPPNGPADGIYTITVPGGQNPIRVFTLTAPGVTTTRTGNGGTSPTPDGSEAVLTRAPYAATFDSVAGTWTPISRTGAVTVNHGDWNMDDTIADLQQTPLRSPTVFNFFEPDFSYPGMLSDAGLLSPEFQITSDITVIRAANFIYSGLFSTNYSGEAGLTSFKNGARDIFIDIRPWMGNKPGAPTAWCDNTNIADLFDTLNRLLAGGQLDSRAKTIITDHVKTLQLRIYDPSDNNPSLATQTSDRRERVRRIVHLITTSSDFTTQK